MVKYYQWFINSLVLNTVNVDDLVIKVIDENRPVRDLTIPDILPNLWTKTAFLHSASETS